MFSILANNLADSGFYINLDDSIERKTFVEKQINNFEIQNLNRFSALSDELRQYSCTKSHRAIFEYALSNGLSSVFVAEDDFEIYRNPIYFNNLSISSEEFLKKYQQFIQHGDYDVLMFGCNPKKQIIPLNEAFGFNSFSTGAWSYIIRARAMKYILDNYHYYRDYQAIDDILPSLNGKGFKTLTTIPMLIGHRNGITSTLQPHIGETYYSGWIEGNWHKHLYERIYSNNVINTIEDIQNALFSNFQLEKKLTVVITGHCVDNWLFYLRYLLKSMPSYLSKCRFIISYDSCNTTDMFNIHRYFRDIKTDICPEISFVHHGLISSLKNILSRIQTDYFLFLEHDWVFLNKDSIDYMGLIDTFDHHDFVNAVWFSKNDNTMRGFEICDDIDGKITPFSIEDRINKVPLVTTCRWSNNPAIFRTSKMIEWFNTYINNSYIDNVHQGASNIEETMIPAYRSQIQHNGWSNIKDNWGTYLYGNIGDGPFVAHTDASRRYQGHNKSQPEINGEQFIVDHPLNEYE